MDENEMHLICLLIDKTDGRVRTCIVSLFFCRARQAKPTSIIPRVKKSAQLTSQKLAIACGVPDILTHRANKRCMRRTYTIIVIQSAVDRYQHLVRWFTINSIMIYVSFVQKHVLLK